MLKVIYGGRRSGRTHQLAKLVAQMVMENKKVAIMSFTKTATDNLSMEVSGILNRDCRTDIIRVSSTGNQLMGLRFPLFVDNYDLLQSPAQGRVRQYAQFNPVYVTIRIDPEIEMINVDHGGDNNG